MTRLGGSIDTDMTAVATMPYRAPPRPVVMMVTLDAIPRNAVLNSSAKAISAGGMYDLLRPKAY
jgi:hypothetical protein